MHWDGNRWSTNRSPNPGDGDVTLESVDAISAGDVWAIGRYQRDGVLRTFAIHWDGDRWSRVPVPTVGGQGTIAMDVAFSSSSSGWAVGVTGGTPDETLFLRWDGSSWEQVDGDPLPAGDLADEGALSGVAPVPGSDSFWAVGEWDVGGEGDDLKPLVERWC
jgi:hypothetical protein